MGHNLNKRDGLYSKPKYTLYIKKINSSTENMQHYKIQDSSIISKK